MAEADITHFAEFFNYFSPWQLLSILVNGVCQPIPGSRHNSVD
jgi:hypothetical protein